MEYIGSIYTFTLFKYARDPTHCTRVEVSVDPHTCLTINLQYKAGYVANLTVIYRQGTPISKTRRVDIVLAIYSGTVAVGNAS